MDEAILCVYQALKAGAKVEDIHDPAVCAHTELIKGREEIKKLKINVSEWKDAWFHQGEVIGNLWWHHPAIEDERQLVYYRNAQRALELKQAPWHVKLAIRFVQFIQNWILHTRFMKKNGRV
jgi:hypothetical protein